MKYVGFIASSCFITMAFKHDFYTGCYVVIGVFIGIAFMYELLKPANA